MLRVVGEGRHGVMMDVGVAGMDVGVRVGGRGGGGQVVLGHILMGAGTEMRRASGRRGETHYDGRFVIVMVLRVYSCSGAREGGRFLNLWVFKGERSTGMPSNRTNLGELVRPQISSRDGFEYLFPWTRHGRAQFICHTRHTVPRFYGNPHHQNKNNCVVQLSDPDCISAPQHSPHRHLPRDLPSPRPPSGLRLCLARSNPGI